MFTHLLVALDGTRHAESMLPYALDLARRLAAEVTFVRVVPSAVASGERGAVGKRRVGPGNFAGAAEAAAYLDKIVDEHRELGIVLNYDVREGDAASGILRAARECGADAIALSTHSRRGLDRLMLGSVAERVLHSTALPVVLLSSRA